MNSSTICYIAMKSYTGPALGFYFNTFKKLSSINSARLTILQMFVIYLVYLVILYLAD